MKLCSSRGISLAHATMSIVIFSAAGCELSPGATPSRCSEAVQCPAGTECDPVTGTCMPTNRSGTPSDLGRYCALAASKGGLVEAFAYSLDFGDLMMLSYNPDSEESHWSYVDGAPPKDGGKDPDVGKYADSAAASDGTLHLAYYDADEGALRYAVKRGGSWAVSVVDNDGDAGRYASLALDYRQRPAIAYAAGHGEAMELRLARLRGSYWQVETVDRGGVGAYASLVYLPQGGVRIAYYDVVGKALKLAAGGTEGYEGIVVDDGVRHSKSGEQVKHDVGKWCSASVSFKGDFGISYFDATSGSLLYTRPGITGNAVVETVAEPGDAGGIVGQFSKLAFGKDATPVIVYQDSTKLDLKIAYRDQDGWRIVDSIGIDQTAAGFWPDILPLDDGGFVVCSYRADIGKDGIPAGRLEIFRWSK